MCTLGLAIEPMYYTSRLQKIGGLILKQIAWLKEGGCCSESEFMLLHLRIDGGVWLPYTSFPQYAEEDYKMTDGSKGWATYQKLRSCGWELVETEIASQLLNC